MASTKPYLIRAIYEWCVDQGHTPYMTVAVDGRAVVPQPYAKNGEIVLNVSPVATQDLVMGNDIISFTARFGGVAQAVSVPIPTVMAIFARESGEGLAFNVADDAEDEAESEAVAETEAADDDIEPPPSTPPAPNGGRPRLTRVK